MKCMEAIEMSSHNMFFYQENCLSCFTQSIHNLQYRAEGDNFFTPFINAFLSQRFSKFIYIAVVRITVICEILNSECGTIRLISFKQAEYECLCETSGSNDTYGMFFLHPFEPGFR